VLTIALGENTFQFFVYDPAVPGPLEGVRVIELGVWVAGPGAGGILADWGADVVKIEPRTGDPARQFGAMLGGDLPFNPPFELDNRGKRGIVVDLAVPAGHAIAMRLVDDADVFVTNVRPAALAPSVSTMSTSPRATRVSSTPRSPATARRARSATGPRTTSARSGPGRASPTC